MRADSSNQLGREPRKRGIMGRPHGHQHPQFRRTAGTSAGLFPSSPSLGDIAVCRRFIVTCIVTLPIFENAKPTSSAGCGLCKDGVPTGIRTPVLSVKGRRPNRARRWGLTAESGTLRRTPRCARLISIPIFMVPAPRDTFCSRPLLPLRQQILP